MLLAYRGSSPVDEDRAVGARSFRRPREIAWNGPPSPPPPPSSPSPSPFRGWSPGASLIGVDSGRIRSAGRGIAEMEGGVSVEEEEKKESMSYRYWVREATGEAAPAPVPRKLTPQDVVSDSRSPATLGSVWNKAGTWEEKNLNKWASDRIQELLTSIGSLEFNGGCAEISEVSNCSGDAFLVTVRNKKRVGYTYELKLRIKGEWTIKEEKKKVKGHLEIPEFSFGELDDLQMDVGLSEEKDLLQQDKQQICKDLKQFLHPVREKLRQFEEELKDR